MNRRETITLLGGSAVSWPLVARAQQGGRMRRIGVLMNVAADDPEGQTRNAALLQGLQEHGWTVGRNMRIEYRWNAGDFDLYRRYAMELIELAPDIVVVNGHPATVAMQQTTRTVPIVFINASDPVGGGLVSSLARPGGNTTGFALPEYGIAGKWLELLKQIAPGVARVAVIRDPRVISGSGQLRAIQAVGPFLGVEVSSIDARDAGEIERGIMAFARGSNESLIVPMSGAGLTHRNLIIGLATRHYDSAPPYPCLSRRHGRSLR
jgi:putative ABC transport system substrate-binding protein